LEQDIEQLLCAYDDGINHIIEMTIIKNSRGSFSRIFWVCTARKNSVKVTFFMRS
jgi:hypothetical protein